MNLVEKLREFSALFDYGCEIAVGEDGISVEGYDYHADESTLKNSSTAVVRSYYAEFDFDEDAQEYKDTLTPLLAQIKAENDAKNARTAASRA